MVHPRTRARSRVWRELCTHSHAPEIAAAAAVAAVAADPSAAAVAVSMRGGAIASGSLILRVRSRDLRSEGGIPGVGR